MLKIFPSFVIENLQNKIYKIGTSEIFELKTLLDLNYCMQMRTTSKEGKKSELLQPCQRFFSGTLSKKKLRKKYC